MISTRAPGSALRTAIRICSAVSTVTTVRPACAAGGGAAVTSVTAAPCASAAAASSLPIFPLDRLPMKRTGSIGSRVPPAVITKRRPDAAGSGPSDKELPHHGDDRIRLGHPARALVTARESSMHRADDAAAASGERRRMALRRRVLPHRRLHGRRDEQRRATRERGGGDGVICETE